MALDANRLGDAIKDAIDAVSDKTDRQALFRAMADAIVTELQDNATVTVTGVSAGGLSATGAHPTGGID